MFLVHLKETEQESSRKLLIERFWTLDGGEVLPWRDHIYIGHIAPTQI